MAWSSYGRCSGAVRPQERAGVTAGQSAPSLTLCRKIPLPLRAPCQRPFSRVFSRFNLPCVCAAREFGFALAMSPSTPAKRVEVMEILWALFIGLIVGALAKLVMPGRDPGGMLVTMLLGVAGSIVAMLIGRVFGWYDQPGQAPGIIASILGAVLLLAIYRASTRRRRML